MNINKKRKQATGADIKNVKKKRFNFYGNLFIVLALALLLTVAGIYAYFTAGPGVERIRRRIEESIEDYLEMDVNIGELDTNLFSRLVIRNVEVFERNSGDNILTLSVGRIDYNLGGILRRRLTIKSVFLDSLETSLTTQIVTDLPPFREEIDEVEEFPLEIILDRVELNRSSIIFSDISSGFITEFRHTDAVLIRSENGGYGFDINTGSGNLKTEEMDFDFHDLSTAGIIEDGDLRFDSILLVLQGMAVSGIAAITPIDINTLRGSFRLEGDPQNLIESIGVDIPPRFDPLGGNCVVDLKIEDMREGLRSIAFDIELEDFTAGQLDILSGSICGRLQNERIKLTEILIELIDEGRIEGEGELFLDELLNHEISLLLEGLELKTLIYLLSEQITPFDGIIYSTVESKGPLRDISRMNADIWASVRNAAYEGSNIPDPEANIRWRQGTGTAEIHAEESTIQASLRQRGNSFDIDFGGEIIPSSFVSVFGVDDLEGSVEMEGSVYGVPDDISLRTSMSGRNIMYSGFPIDALHADVIYSDGDLIIENGRFSGYVSLTELSSQILGMENIRGGTIFDGEFGRRDGEFYGEAVARVDSLGYNDFEFDGGLVNAEMVRGLVNIKPSYLRRGITGAGIEGVYDLAFSKGSVKLDFEDIPPEIILREGRETAISPVLDHLMLMRDDDKGVDVQFDLDDSSLPLAKISGRKVNLEIIHEFLLGSRQLGGITDFDITLEDVSEFPQGRIDLHGRDISWEETVLDRVSAEVMFGKGVIELISLAADIKGSPLKAEGSVELSQTPDGGYAFDRESLTRGFISGENIDLSVLESMIHISEGRCSFLLRWDGSLDYPSAHGNIDIMDAKLQLSEGTPPLETLNTSIVFRDSLLRIESLNGIVHGLPLNLSGDIIAGGGNDYSIDAALSIAGVERITAGGDLIDGRISMDFNSEDFDLSVLRAFLPGLAELEGIVDSRIRLEGELNNPVFTGNAVIEELRFRPDALETPFTNGHLSMSFDKDSIQIDSLTVRAGGGVISAEGNVSLSDFERPGLDLTASVNNVRISSPGNYNITFDSAKLSYTGKGETYLLDGAIVLGRTTFTRDFQPADLVALLRASHAPAETPGIVGRTRLNLRLSRSGEILVDNNVARLQVDPEILLRGTTSSPIATGRISVIEGYIYYIDRRFTVNRGVADFIDPVRINPIIDFEAVNELDSRQTYSGINYLITLKITGHVDEAMVELTSDPPLDRTNIVALLTVGATREELLGGLGGDSQLGQILLQRIEQLSTQTISSYVSRQMQDLLGIQDVTIEGNLFAYGEEWGPRLVASRKVSDRLEISYTTAVGHLNDQGVRVQYDISRRLSLEGYTDQTGRSWLDLKFGFRFR